MESPLPAAVNPEKNVIGTEEKFALGEVHQQRDEILSAPLISMWSRSVMP